MNSITQDMRFRLFVVKSYDRVGATKTAIRIKFPVNLFTSGFAVLMVISILLTSVRINLLLILNNILI